MESVIRHLKVDHQDCYFWAVHGQAELDLLIVRETERIGFEFKYSKTPQLTRAMELALENLKLAKLTIIYPGEQPIRLTKAVECVGLESFLQQ